MKNIFRIFIFIGIAALVSACGTKTTEVVYTGSGIPGTMVGQVILEDTTNEYVKDKSGIEVMIEGTNFKTVTDSAGIWSIDNVAPGAYYLLFHKEGYGTNHYGIVEFAANGTDYFNTTIYQINLLTPELVIRPFEKRVTILYRDTVIIDSAGTPVNKTIPDSISEENGQATFTVKFLDLNPFRFSVYGKIFFSKNPSMTPMDPNSYSYSEEVSYVYPDKTNTDIILLRSHFLQAGFLPSDKIYCTAFLGGESGREEYMDIKSLKYIYTGFSPYTSGVKSFILP